MSAEEVEQVATFKDPSGFLSLRKPWARPTGLDGGGVCTARAEARLWLAH